MTVGRITNWRIAFKTLTHHHPYIIVSYSHANVQSLFTISHDYLYWIRSVFLSQLWHAVKPTRYLSICLPLNLFSSSLSVVTKFSSLFILIICLTNLDCLRAELSTNFVFHEGLALLFFCPFIISFEFSSETTFTLQLDVSQFVCTLHITV